MGCVYCFNFAKAKKKKKRCLQDFTGALKPVISLCQSTQPLPYGKIEQQKMVLTLHIEQHEART